MITESSEIVGLLRQEMAGYGSLLALFDEQQVAPGPAFILWSAQQVSRMEYWNDGRLESAGCCIGILVPAQLHDPVLAGEQRNGRLPRPILQRR